MLRFDLQKPPGSDVIVNSLETTIVTGLFITARLFGNVLFKTETLVLVCILGYCTAQ